MWWYLKPHNVIVTIGGEKYKDTGHSNSVKDMDYKNSVKIKPYFEWFEWFHFVSKTFFYY